MYLVVLLLVLVTASTYNCCSLDQQEVAICDDCCDGATPCPADPGSHDLLDLVSGCIARLGSRFAAVLLQHAS